MNNVLYPNFGNKRNEDEGAKPEVISAGRPRVDVTPLAFSGETRNLIAESRSAAAEVEAELARVGASVDSAANKVLLAENVTSPNERQVVNL